MSFFPLDFFLLSLFFALPQKQKKRSNSPFGRGTSMELAPEHRLVVGASGLFFVFWNERFEKERKVFEFFFLLFFYRSPPKKKLQKKTHRLLVVKAPQRRRLPAPAELCLPAPRRERLVDPTVLGSVGPGPRARGGGSGCSGRSGCSDPGGEGGRGGRGRGAGRPRGGPGHCADQEGDGCHNCNRDQSPLHRAAHVHAAGRLPVFALWR